jgi:transposase
MAKFRQNRLFIIAEGFQRFGLKPGLPVEFIAGEMSGAACR